MKLTRRGIVGLLGFSLIGGDALRLFCRHRADQGKRNDGVRFAVPHPIVYYSADKTCIPTRRDG